MPKLSKRDHRAKVSASEARRRKEVALARIREIEAAKAEGRFVDIADVEQVFGQHIATARSRLLGIPTSAAPELALEMNPAKVEAILKRHIYEALTELASGAAIVGEATQK